MVVIQFGIIGCWMLLSNFRWSWLSGKKTKSNVKSCCDWQRSKEISVRKVNMWKEIMMGSPKLYKLQQKPYKWKRSYLYDYTVYVKYNLTIYSNQRLKK